MEWIDKIASLISSVGFPCVCAGAMFWLNYKTQETIKELSNTIDLNTKAIEQLKDKIKEE